MPGEIDWEKLARATVHPLAVRLLELYAALDNDGRLSPKEAADALEAPLGNVAYHVRVLADAGLLAPAGEGRARGAVVHFYRLA